MNIPKITTANHWTQVYQILRAGILQRKFGPNEKIGIPELAAHLGVSPTPIRDALGRLEAEGLIRTVPKVGTFVAPVGTKRAADMIESRLMMETWVLDKWPELPDPKKAATIDRLRALTGQADQPLDGDGWEPRQEGDPDREFHLTFIASGGNEHMAEVYETTLNYRVFNLARKWITPEMHRKTWLQHRDIVDSLASGDLRQAREAVETHLDSSKRNLLAIMEQSGGFL